MNEKELIKFVKPLYKTKDSMHNFNHILRIKRKVANLQKDYSDINEKRLKMLIYFHGLKKWIKENKKKFLNLGFNKKDILLIHRHTKNPKTIEEKLVNDANLLEAVGRFGIKKALIVGKERGRNRAETIDYIRKNINKVRFYTKRGKKSGYIGVKITKDFLKKQ